MSKFKIILLTAIVSLYPMTIIAADRTPDNKDVSYTAYKMAQGRCHHRMLEHFFSFFDYEACIEEETMRYIRMLRQELNR